MFALSTGAEFLPSTVANLQWNVFFLAKADAMKLDYFWSLRPRYCVRKKRWKQDMPGIKPSQIFGKEITLHFPFCLLQGLNLRVFCHLDVHRHSCLAKKTQRGELFLVEIGRTFRGVCLVKGVMVWFRVPFPPPRNVQTSNRQRRNSSTSTPMLRWKFGGQWKITKIDSKAM